MSDCVICSIISGSIPSWIIHQNAHVICFLPKEMEVHGHTVIAPIDHHPDIYSGTDESMAALMAAARSLALHYRQRLGASGVNLLHASGASAQQSVGHMHLHLLPRFDSDGVDAWPTLPGTKVSKDEFLASVREVTPTILSGENEDHLLLSGIKDPGKLDSYFVSSLVDVAYATPLADGKIMVTVEADTDLRNPEDLEWMLRIIADTLKINGETSASIEVIYSPPSRH